MGNYYSNQNIETEEVKQPQLTKLDLIYFWKSNQNPNDPEETPEWTPFDLEDQLILEENFQNFLNDPNKNEVELKSLEPWKIDFNKWMQINKTDNSVKIPIKRDNPKFLSNISRPERFLNNLEESNIHPILNFTNYENCDQHYGGYKKVVFSVLDNLDLTIKIKKDICPFDYGYRIKMPFEDFKEILKDEISNIAMLSNKKNSIPLYNQEINSLENSPKFFEVIIKIFNMEGFLYKKINEFLRNSLHFEFESIKYFYISILACFEYYRINGVCPKFLKEDLVVYRATSNSPEDIEDSENKFYIKNKTRIYKEFMITTMNREMVLNFFDKENSSKLECLYEITIPKEIIRNEYNKFLILNNLSYFPSEQEVLINSGSLLFIHDIIPYSEYNHTSKRKKNIKNKFIKRCTLRSFSLESFLEILKLDNSITEINLSTNNLGENLQLIKEVRDVVVKSESIKSLNLSRNFLDIVEPMKIVKEMITINKSINKLDLSENHLGTNIEIINLVKDMIEQNHVLTHLNLSLNKIGVNTEVVKVLKEMIVKNQSITHLDLSDNNLGQNLDAMKLIKEMIIENTSIRELNLSKNFIGENVKAMREIKEMIVKNKIITHLDLKFNKIGNNFEIMKLIKEMVIQNESIRHLDFSYDNINFRDEYIEIQNILKEKVLNI